VSKSTIVIYHADCPDGLCAGWIAWRKFGELAEYYPAQYSADPPDVTGRDVYVVDFCYPRNVTEQLVAQASRVVILDHHASAQRDLEAFAGRSCVAADYEGDRDCDAKLLIEFDMQRSGAGLARDYFFPGEENWVVDYVQDRDLWRFALGDSATLNAYLQTLSTFEELDYAYNEVSLGTAKMFGAGAEAYRDMLVRKVKAHAIRQRFAGFDNIPVVNAHFVGISELLGELAQGALFAVGWYQRNDGSISYSLRSRGDFDCSKLAELFGGGGHKGAAGFRLDWKVPGVDHVSAETTL
jgi:uncharacterized protein